MSKKKTTGAPAASSAPRTTKQPATEAAYFLSLGLRNIRCFGDEEQQLVLADVNGRPARWTLLLGSNGVGKTTVLECLATIVTAREIPDPFDWSTWGHDLGYYRLGNSTESELQTALTVTLARAPNLDPAGPAAKPESFTFDRRSHQFVCTSAEPQPCPNPLCFGYGAGRRAGLASLRANDSDDPIANLFSDVAELRDAEGWLLRLDYSASKPSSVQQRQQDRLAHVRQLLIAILPEVEDISFSSVGEVNPSPAVEFKTPYGRVPLRQLGYGYRTLIAWMVDFASRMVERYPDSPDPLAEPAVVLVDEIDLHLHPKWQRQLIGYLTERFPNTQFIATAHSPLIVQAANAVGANLVLLKREGDHVIIENDPPALRGWSVDQLLTSELYDLPSPYPAKYDELFARREALLAKEKLTKSDLKELKRLDKEMGELPLGDTAQRAKTTMLIRDTLQLLEKRAGEES